MNPRQMKMMSAAVVYLLSASGAVGGISAEGYDVIRRTGDRSVLVWCGSGQVRVSEPCTVDLLLVGGGGGGNARGGDGVVIIRYKKSPCGLTVVIR